MLKKINSLIISQHIYNESRVHSDYDVGQSGPRVAVREGVQYLARARYVLPYQLLCLFDAVTLQNCLVQL